jgi:RNA polymerase sigma factor (TIGR02999 family)
MTDVTQILSEIEHGDPAAAERLLPLVYDELRKLAAAKLANEKPGQTLQPTALVHEAYLRLVSSELTPQWDGRGHFFFAAAEAMRRILVEAARRKASLKHGGEFRRVELLEADGTPIEPDEQLLNLNEALLQLAQARPQAAELIKLRFFAGLTLDEAATIFGMSSRSTRRLWIYARAWLRRHMDVDSERNC